MGIEIQLAPRDEAAKALADLSPKSASAGGYVVRGMDAVESLYQAGKHDAAAYWDIPVPPPYLVFARDCCELV